VDLTLTEEYQQEPMFLAHSEMIREKLSARGIVFEDPIDYFKLQNQIEGNKDVTYLELLKEDAGDSGVFKDLCNQELFEFGTKVKAAPGLSEGLRALKERFSDRANIRYFLISVGIKPMINGFLEANSLCDIVENVAASEFHEENGRIAKLKEVVTASDKIKWMIAFSKGGIDNLNKMMFPGQYDFGLSRGIVVGDGFTDTPMFSYGKNEGALACALYGDGDFSAYEKALETVGHRSDYVIPRNFTPGSTSYNLFKEMVQRQLQKSCEFIPSQLQAYKKGKPMHESQIECVETHLNECTQCQDYFSTTIVSPQGTIERIKRDVTRI